MKNLKRFTLLLFLVASAILVFEKCKKKEDNDDVLYGKISGIVTDSETDEPIKGATVNLSPSGSSKTTGDDGRYQFEKLDADEYTIQAKKEGYETNSKDIKVEAGQTTTGDIALTPLKPEIVVTPTNDMNFGTTEITKNISITNTGTGTLTFDITIVPAEPWVSVTPAKGEVESDQTEPITIKIEREGQEPGTYDATMLINSNGGEAIQIGVQMQVPEQNASPIATFECSPTSGELSEIFTFDASDSDDPDGSNDALTFNWNFGDGEGYHGFSTNDTVQNQFSVSGSYTISLIVKDHLGAMDSTTRNITVLENDPPTVEVTSCPGTVAIDQEFTLDVSGTTDDNDDLEDIQFAYQWEDGTGFSDYTYNYQPTYSYEDPGIKTISIKAKDSHGAESNPVTRNIEVEQPTLATVTTGEESYVTHNSAYFSGEITDLGNGVSQVDQHGHCWSLSPGPNIDDDEFTELGATSETGTFNSQLTGLSASTTYYVRAYAINAAGLQYGTEKTFTTIMPYPPGGVTTGAITNIYQNSAVAAGTIVNLGVGTTVIEHGHCWSTSQNPTTANLHTTLGPYSGSTPHDFESDIDNLSAGTTYHVRAYIETDQGTVYGENVSFTTLSK